MDMYNGQLFLLFYLIPRELVMGQRDKLHQKLVAVAGFHFAAHKHTDVRHECTTDGEKKGRDVRMEGVQV